MDIERRKYRAGEEVKRDTGKLCLNVHGEGGELGKLEKLAKKSY
jgi:hypothetical protein